MNKKVFGTICIVLFAAGSVMMTNAFPAVGVTPTLIVRGTYEILKLKSNTDCFKCDASAKPAIDMWNANARLRTWIDDRIA